MNLPFNGNLPPGCREGDIPGNSYRDEAMGLIEEAAIFYSCTGCSESDPCHFEGREHECPNVAARVQDYLDDDIDFKKLVECEYVL